MALTITTTITVADDEAYTEREAAILAAIANHPAGKGGFPGNGNTHTAEQAAAQAAAPAAPAEKSAASKAADARIAEARAKQAAEAKAAKAAKAEEIQAAHENMQATVAAQAEEEDLVAAPAQEYTMDDAVTRATELVNASRAAEVKAALAVAGAKRVSELKGAAIATFMNELAA